MFRNGNFLPELLHVVGACPDTASVLVGPELNSPTRTGPAGLIAALVGIRDGTASVLVVPELNSPPIPLPLKL